MDVVDRQGKGLQYLLEQDPFPPRSQIQLNRTGADVISYNAGISACETQPPTSILSYSISIKLLLWVVGRCYKPGCGGGGCGHYTYLSPKQRTQEKAGQWQVALGLLLQVLTVRLQADAVSYNACISACAKGRQWQVALILLSEMLESRISANTISFNAAISACEKGGQWDRALQLLSELPTARLVGDVITYNASISACETGPFSKQALLSSLIEYPPKSVPCTFNTSESNRGKVRSLADGSERALANACSYGGCKRNQPNCC